MCLCKKKSSPGLCVHLEQFVSQCVFVSFYSCFFYPQNGSAPFTFLFTVLESYFLCKCHDPTHATGMQKGILSLLFLEDAEPEFLCPLAASHIALHELTSVLAFIMLRFAVYLLFIFPSPSTRPGNSSSIKNGSSVVYDILNRASINIECQMIKTKKRSQQEKQQYLGYNQKNKTTSFGERGHFLLSVFLGEDGYHLFIYLFLFH